MDPFSVVHHIEWDRIVLFRTGRGFAWFLMYEGWNFNSGIYLFTTDTK